MNGETQKFKVQTGLKNATAEFVTFYFRISGLSLEELKVGAGPFKFHCRRKSKKGGKRLALHIAIHENTYRNLKPLAEGVQKGNLQLEAPGFLSFNLYYEKKIPKKDLIQKGEVFLLKFSESVNAYYAISGHFAFSKRLLENLKVESSSFSGKPPSIIYSSPKSKRDMGVSQRSPSRYKQCVNCLYFSKDRCGLLNVKVKKSETWSRFNSPRYREVSGGRFSPK
ncbi:hypothetical protein V1502_18735 [Bacillus sp. SCS-153A]|uniref:hypothetical protein n=1 Tax=Rossellomorea sedimentorum TaxID=3115294 RepID=UPI00390601E6